jgi:molybdopterin biosynthesis enzyme
MIDDSSIQRITKLTPLSAVLALIEARVDSVPARAVRPVAVHGLTLAEDVVAPQCPPLAIALRDGFAVDSAAIADAGPYMPVALAANNRVDAGHPMPRGTDAVLSPEAVTSRGETIKAIGSVLPGEGVLPTGGDAMPQTLLRGAGQRLRAIDVAAFSAARIEAISIREPRISIALGGVGDRIINGALGILIHAVFGVGGMVSQNQIRLDAALAEAESDAIIAVGGTGSGRRDVAVQNLARLGRVEMHGIAISPGATAAFGFVGKQPVLLVPGRLDAALAAWLLIGRHLVAKLAGGTPEFTATTLPLKRKATSTIGMTELVPVSCADGVAEPLGGGYLSLTALAHSDGWIVIPADSEGFPAGTPVAVQPWF